MIFVHCWHNAMALESKFKNDHGYNVYMYQAVHSLIVVLIPSVGHLTRKSEVLGSIPGLATYFRFSFRCFKRGSCQLLAKVCARSPAQEKCG